MALPTDGDVENCFSNASATATGNPTKLKVSNLRTFLKNMVSNYLTSVQLSTKPGLQSYLIISGNAAPADAELDANQMAIYFTPTNGSAALSIKAKQANGTVKTGTVAVTT